MGCGPTPQRWGHTLGVVDRTGEANLGTYPITDAELRANHEFVVAYDTLRRRFGVGEMSDGALREIAQHTGLLYETLRVMRHLRNGLAHPQGPVNREAIDKYHRKLVEVVGAINTTPAVAVAAASDVSAFRIHAWKDPQFEQEEIANGFVAMGGEEIGDLSWVEDPEVIRAKLTQSMPDRSTQAIGIFVGYWRRFLWEAATGDLVALPTRGRDVAIGEFVGPYGYVGTAKPRARHRRAVSWDTKVVTRDAFGPDLLNTLSGMATILQFKAPNAASRLRALTKTGIDPGPEHKG